MPSTRTRGITVDVHGHRTINKEYRGERIFLRLGSLAQEDAEHRLLVEIEHLELEIERRVCGTRLQRAYAPPVLPRKIAPPCSVTLCGQCPSFTRAPMWGAS